MNMKFLTFFLLFAGTLLSAQTLPEGMQITSNGIVKFSGGEIALNIFAAGWTGLLSNARFTEIRTDHKAPVWSLSGKCTLSAVNGNVTETIRTQAPDRFTLEYQVRMDRPVAAAIASGVLLSLSARRPPPSPRRASSRSAAAFTSSSPCCWKLTSMRRSGVMRLT